MTETTAFRLPWRAASTALVIAGVLGWVGVVVRSHHGEVGLERQLAEVADASARELIAAIAWIFATAAFIAAGALTAIVAHARGSRSALVGALLLAIGGAWITAAPGAAAVVLHMLATGGLESASIADLTDALEGDPAWLVTLPLMVAFAAAPVLLAIGLRSMRVPLGAWVAALWVVSVVVALAFYGNRTGEVIGCGGMMVAHCLIALALRRGERATAA